MADEVADKVVDRLLAALAALLDISAPAMNRDAVEALADLGRDEANLIFGNAGLLIHYGADTQRLETLIQLISDIQRGEAMADAAIKPGDKVRLVGKLPGELAEYDGSLAEIVFVVRYVSRDGTLDVQTEFAEDYWIATVPIVNVEPARTQDAL